jgi:hypothetical protein
MTKSYGLVKHKYGWKVGRLNNAYTAFCLTPALDKPTEVNVGGKSVTATNEESTMLLDR